MVHSDYGQHYTGEVNNRGERHGRGTLQFQNKTFKYVGEWLNGEKHGTGKLYIGPDSYYEGQFNHGEITGSGVRVTPDWTYAGEFLLGEKSGHGSQVYSDGMQYHGLWERNQFNGTGTLTLPNGDVFVGTFVNNKRCGMGKLECINGDKYEGEWLDNQQHGQGKAIWTTETQGVDIYEGQWIQGKRSGMGEFIDCITGLQYNGEWVDDRPTKVPSHISLRFANWQVNAENTEEKDNDDQLAIDHAAPVVVRHGDPWANYFCGAVLSTDVDGKTRAELRNSLVREESGRVIGVFLQEQGATQNAAPPIEGEEQQSPWGVCVAQGVTTHGLVHFTDKDCMVSEESLKEGKYIATAKDLTPGLHDDERLFDSTCIVHVVSKDGTLPTKRK